MAIQMQSRKFRERVKPCTDVVTRDAIKLSPEACVGRDTAADLKRRSESCITAPA